MHKSKGEILRGYVIGSTINSAFLFTARLRTNDLIRHLFINPALIYQAIHSLMQQLL